MDATRTKSSSLIDAIRRLVAGQLIVLWIGVLLGTFWLNSVRHTAAEYLRVGFAFDGMYMPGETPAQIAQRQQNVVRRQRDAEDRVFLTKGAIAALFGVALAV